MKVIRFRAWDRKFHKMVGLKGLQDFFSIRSDGLPSNEHYELMQYTGMEDVYDKEIYEGDIVKIKNEFGEYGECFSDVIAIAIMEGWGAWFKVNDELEIPMDITYQNGREVIGNIWENPELLKE